MSRCTATSPSTFNEVLPRGRSDATNKPARRLASAAFNEVLPRGRSDALSRLQEAELWMDLQRSPPPREE